MDDMDIPTEQEIDAATVPELYDYLEDLTRRLDFCIQTGLRQGTAEMAAALTGVLSRLEVAEPSLPPEAI